MKTLHILGVTGLVGQALLELALQNLEISREVASTRRPLTLHAKLDNPWVNFEALPEIENTMNRLFFKSSLSYRTILGLLFLCFASVANAKSSDPLPSWNNGVSKSAIVQFVKSVTKKGGVDFVPTAERIATFDNDGTLWSEQPIAQLCRSERAGS